MKKYRGLVLSLSKGFTLIELLVVIAIIGILSAIVLASLNTARDKGSDAAVQADITGIRTQAEIYRNNNNSYGTEGAGCYVAESVVTEETVAKQIAAADAANGTAGTVSCNVAAGGAAYAVSAELVSAPGTYFCIDNTGTATTTATELGTGTICS